MERDTVKKCCGSCKYFEQHYSWTGRSFCAVNCGHCANPLKAMNEGIAFNYFTVCRLWEDGGNEKKLRNESIVEAVRQMIERIDEITAVFKDGGKS